MAGYKEPDYFAKARRAGRIVVKGASYLKKKFREPPKLDLDAYITNYKGRTRFDRLLLIGTSSSYLYIDALKAAIAEAKSGKNISRYEIAISTLQEIAPSDRDAILDRGWIDKTAKQVQAETDRLELELKGYKNNLIKESIRMGYDDLGQHFHLIGELGNSSKAYGKMRDYCTTPAHIVIMSLRIINVSIDQQNWLAVQANVQRLRNQNQRYPDAEKIAPKLSAAMGLAHLASDSYRDAAESFLRTDARMISAKVDDLADEEAYNEVLTPNDVAVYGGLCALASMTRDELQRNVLENSSFRNYLELEPHIRRAVSFFVSSKYSACLSILDSYKADYLLDVYLQRHVQELYFRIRSKAIQQYFIPFSRVTFNALAASFNTDETTIEHELTSMIKRRSLDARIDLVDRVLVANTVDERRKVHEQALAMAEEYARTAHLRILRMEILNAGLEIKTPKGQTGVLALTTQDPFSNGSMDVFMGGAGQGPGPGRSGLRSGARI